MRAASIDTMVVTHLANVQYLTGLSASAGAAIVLPSGCRLVVDFRYVTVAEALAETFPGGTMAVDLVDRSFEDAIVGVLRREGSLRVGIEAAYLPVARFNAMSAGLAGSRTNDGDGDPAPALVATERVVERVRAIKDESEIAALRQAALRLSAVARRLPDFTRAGRTELEVARAIDAALQDEGFSRPAFDTIVASGPNSALPHARPTGRVLASGDPTVLDFGGVYGGYCVDLTRTVQIGPAPPDLRRMYTAVAEAQRAAISAVRPGVKPSAIDAAARNVLRQYGLADAFGHGTGHGIGLEIHEEPRVSRPAPGLPDEPVEPGMVFTIEPGAYIPGLGGVRIEDDVLVTADGCEVLTNCPQLFD
jgi:Xaa-Pro aminopeptidase